MQFLRATRTPATVPFWQSVASSLERPAILRELLRDESVVCDRAEMDEALRWASAQPGWSDEEPAVWTQEAW